MSVIFINPFWSTGGGGGGDPIEVDQTSVYAIVGQSETKMTVNQTSVYTIVGQSETKMTVNQTSVYVIVEV